MAKTFNQYFPAVAAKRLSAVEVDPHASHQHELNGVTLFRSYLGAERIEKDATFIYLAETEDLEPEHSRVTWYDAREAHPTRTEYRLYYTRNAAFEHAAAGDLLVMAITPDRSLYFFVAAATSTFERQLIALFGLDDLDAAITRSFETDTHSLQYYERVILEKLGFETEPDTDAIDVILNRFGSQFPTTREFSRFARESGSDTDPLEDPDGAIITWLDHEEQLFRLFEKHLVGQRMGSGFADPDELITFCQSVLQRRRSRVGHAFENHLRVLFDSHQLKYSSGKYTERRAKPDFIFPGIMHYNNLDFPENSLTLLGAKHTAKDRWRQILSEAARIPEKHMITVEPGISEDQTNEMKASLLTIVVPTGIHPTYTDTQRSFMLTVKEFIALVKERQSSVSAEWPL